MNAHAAILYLQALINEPLGTLPNGHRDLGWCCSEHALILSHALIASGAPCHVAEGSVFIKLEQFGERVVKHWFVLSDTLPSRIYDSSIRFREVCGVFPDGIVQPVPAHLCEERTEQENPPQNGIWYFREKIHDPRRYITETSKTPYGDWLTSLAVNHHHFWLAASATTAAILQRRITPPTVLPSRRRLVEETARRNYLVEWI